MLLVTSAGAQTDPPDWHRYTIKGEQFSVALPAQPSLDYRLRRVDSRERLEITLGAYAEGVVYLIRVFENRSQRQSLGSFIDDRTSSGHRLNRKTERDLTIEGIAGKTFSFDGTVQFFSKGDRLYQFTAYGAPQDDVRVTRFFSSISLVDNKDAFKLPDEVPSQPSTAGTTSGSNDPEQIFSPKEVDKSFQPVLNPLPEYTEAARQKQIKGTVVLRCTLSANGQVTTIQVVEGLPHGLTEMAIAAARKLRFIPAMKDGKYVSVSTQLVYTFNLYHD
jgi:TonB family protein